ncbi:MAG: SGNH/GDSL hydrolase family protein [Anaerolineae bacterium]|nr:SGNH/GDSL hydrolase family protein [Anaerolineae bacterium]
MFKKLAKPLVAILFGLLVAILTAEIMARVMVARGILPNRMPADLFTAHATGWTLEPNLHARIFSTNGLVEIKVNETGFRDKTYPRTRQTGVTRLLVLGDSFTLALETPQQDTFHVLLEERYGGAVEVISMASSGYETLQEYLVYQYVGRDYKPDVVLLMLYVGNDLDGNGGWPDLPYYSLNDGELTLHQYPYTGEFNLPLVVGQRATPLMKTSMLAFIAGSILINRDQDAVLARDECDYIAASNYPDLLPGDWALTEALLLALRDAVEADGGDFKLAVLPTELQVEDDDLADFRADCEEANDVDSTPLQDRLNIFLDANGFDYLDLLPALRAARQATGQRMYLPRTDIHWTRDGHAAVADALYDWLDLEP